MMADYSYNQVTPELIEAFKKIVPGKVFTGDEINADYSHDEMPIYGKGAPTVLVEATTREDVAAIVKLCYENSIPVIPRGAGTGLTGGICCTARRCHDRHVQDEQDSGV